MEKLNQCLNCEVALPDKENFCPNCGQKNHATRLRLRAFLDELVNSIFNVDARLWLTLKKAFSNVGNLAKEYNQGKRKKYVPPVQFYLFASLIYFLILGMLAKVDGEKKDVKFQENFAKLDTAKSVKGSIFYLDFDLEGKELLAIPTYSKQQMNDLLVEQGHLPTFYNRFLFKQSLIQTLGGVSGMQQQIVSIASGGMFLLIPVLAWLCYLFFSKTYAFYVEHLVFVIYLQSIAFFIATFKNIFQIIEFQSWLNDIGRIIIAVYTIIALQQFYNKGWLKTIGYFLLLLLLYGMVLVTFLGSIFLITLILS